MRHPHGNDYYCSRALCSVHVHVHLECAGSDVLVAGMNIRSMYAWVSGAYVCRRFLLTYLLSYSHSLFQKEKKKKKNKQALLLLFLSKQVRCVAPRVETANDTCRAARRA